MGTVVRRNVPNGEVPRPLRSFVSSWETYSPADSAFLALSQARRLAMVSS